MVSPYRRVFFLVVAFLLIAYYEHAVATTLRTVALSDEPAPGTFVDFNSLLTPALNANGRTALVATVTGFGVDFSNNYGVWSEGSGNLQLVARSGDQAPGTSSGVNFRGGVGGRPFLDPVVNSAGHTAFVGFLTGTGTNTFNNTGIWSDASGNLALLARAGSQAPDAPSGVNFSTFSQGSRETMPVLNEVGHIAFVAGLTGSGVTSANNQGIWSESSGSLALVARKGFQAADAPSGVNYNGFSDPVLNNDGQLAFRASLTGSGVHSMNDRGIWSGESGSLQLVARAGNQAEGISNGINYDEFASPVINAAGQTAFRATLTSGGEGIWSGGSGSLQLVIRSGIQAPGTSSTFVSFDPPVLNQTGNTSFKATLFGGSEGIWSEESGGLQLVARTGTQAAGTPNGIDYESLGPPTLNATGQTAFRATLTGSGVDSSNDEGIWATDENGTLQLIVREGDMLEVSESDFRTIGPFFISGGVVNFVGGSGNGDGRRSGFNDDGQIAFRVGFTDGSVGIFVSDQVAGNSSLPGDYNQDGKVDAADYVVWRKTDGSNQSAYNVWQSNFGRTQSGGSARYAKLQNSLVPELSSLQLFAVGIASLVAFRKRLLIAKRSS